MRVDLARRPADASTVCRRRSAASLDGGVQCPGTVIGAARTLLARLAHHHELNLTRLTFDDAGVNYSVSYMLQRLGFKGSDAIVVLAERGFVTELRCVMPTCYCPGGRGFFEGVGGKIPDDFWTPTQDHSPLTKELGGHLVPENVRLAHKRCNGFDWGESDSHHEMRARASQLLADDLAMFGSEALWSRARRDQHPDNAPDFYVDPSGRRGSPARSD